MDTNPRDSFNYATLPYIQHKYHRCQRVKKDLPADWFPMTTIRGRSTTACPLFDRISFVNTVMSETDEVTPSLAALLQPAIMPSSFRHIDSRRERHLSHPSWAKVCGKIE